MLVNVNQAFANSVKVPGRHNFPLISVAENVGGEEVRRIDYETDALRSTPSIRSGAPWSIVKTRLHGGRQEGVEAVDLNNGRMTIRTVPTRGFEIWDVNLQKAISQHPETVRFGMNSPVSQEIVAPWLIKTEAFGGLGWGKNGFGALLNRCGLSSASNPGPDQVTSNTGAISTVNLPLHGELQCLPASEFWMSVDSEAPHTLRLHALVNEWQMFGPKLSLESTLSTVPESTKFRLDEAIVNHGSTPAEMMTMFHLNFGEPVLDEGASFVSNIYDVEPRDEFASAGNWQEALANYGPSSPGAIERVFYGKLIALGQTGVAEALLRNSRKDLGVSLRYPVISPIHGTRGGLPYYTHWVNLDSDARNVAFEPGTNWSKHRSVERAAGRLITLEPGERYSYFLDFDFHDSTSAVDEVAQRILSMNHI